MRAMLFVVLLAAPLHAAEVKVTCTLGAVCTDAGPKSRWDLPSCASYNLVTGLIESAERGDQAAVDHLRKRYESAETFAERHRIAAVLLRVKNDAAIWRDVAELAEDAVRFAPDANGNFSEEFQRWCERRQYEPSRYWSAAVEAMKLASDHPRLRPILLRALETENEMVIAIAIRAFAKQKDESVLPLIERALARTEPTNAVWLAHFASDNADRIAAKYIAEHQREYYKQMRLTTE